MRIVLRLMLGTVLVRQELIGYALAVQVVVLQPVSSLRLRAPYELGSLRKVIRSDVNGAKWWQHDDLGPTGKVFDVTDQLTHHE